MRKEEGRKKKEGRKKPPRSSSPEEEGTFQWPAGSKYPPARARISDFL